MFKSPWTRWGAVLGFALGGFFDGILLHQILQWHHLLSLVPGMADMRLQVLWDGYFHALMYVIAAVGLVGLGRAHKSGQQGGGRALCGGGSLPPRGRHRHARGSAALARAAGILPEALAPVRAFADQFGVSPAVSTSKTFTFRAFAASAAS